jgi:DNA-directed RNA polymerase subunit M/transcription elongation factor TFIIS
MKFCEKCGSVMQKNTTAVGEVVFQCKCQQINGGPDDTLMAEGFVETSEAAQKHMVFIENSSYDPAANVILRDCPSCGLNYLTLIRVGVNETTMYSCSCGYLATHSEYMDGEKGSDKGSDKSSNTGNGPTDQGAKSVKINTGTKSTK